MPLPDLSEYTEIAFPRDSEIVYVLCAVGTDAKQLHPFYVGQSGRSFGRLGDYQAAKFSAPTDFKVGSIVQALRGKGIEVIVKYKPSSTRRADEARLLREYKAMNVPLLNHVKGYNYKTATVESQLTELEAFTAQLIQRVGAPSSSDA